MNQQVTLFPLSLIIHIMLGTFSHDVKVMVDV